MKRLVVILQFFSLVLLALPCQAAKPLLKPMPPVEPQRPHTVFLRHAPTDGGSGYMIESDLPLVVEAYPIPQLQRFVVDFQNLADDAVVNIPRDHAKGVRRVVERRKEINGLMVRRILFDLAAGYEGHFTLTADGKRGMVSFTLAALPSTGPTAVSPASPRQLSPVVPAAPRPVGRLLSRIEAVDGGIRLVTGSPVDPSAVFSLSSPPRLVIDLPPIQVTAPSETRVERHGIRRVRVGRSADRVRVVLDVAGDVIPPHRVVREADGLLIRIQRSP